MNDWQAILIALLLILVATGADTEGFDRICNDEHIQCEAMQ